MAILVGEERFPGPEALRREKENRATVETVDLLFGATDGRG